MEYKKSKLVLYLATVKEKNQYLKQRLQKCYPWLSMELRISYCKQTTSTHS